MSKSRGNIVEPWDVIDTFGADAFRWYLFASKYPWDGYRFSVESLGEAVHQFRLQLWNTYRVYVMYANANGIDSGALALDSVELTDLDRWALSRLHATVATVDETLADFDATTGARAISEFVDDLSNWYVRRSRRRFWDGDSAAFATLHHILVTTAKLLAPYTPFIADEIYGNLTGTVESVHLTDFPVASHREPELEQAMAVARETVRLGLAARSQSKIKLRQPLHAAVVVASGAEREAIERLAGIVRDELNVRELRFVSQADELGEIEIKANYRTLGPRFGPQMPLAAAAVAGLSGADVANALREGRTIGINVGGVDHTLTADDLLISMQPPEGYQVEREGQHGVALELEIDESLRIEGWAREIVHAVQSTRRDADLDVSDRIKLVLDGADELLGAARAYETYLSGETLAQSIAYEVLANGFAGTSTQVDGLDLRIAVTRV